MPLTTLRRRALSAVIGAALGATLAALPSLASPSLASPSFASPSVPTPSKAALDKQIKAASIRLEIVVEQYNGIQESLHATKARELVLLKQLTPMQAAVDAAQTKVAQIALHVYEATPLSGYALLADAPSAHAAADRLMLLSRLAVGRQAEFDTLDSAARAYRVQQQTLTALDQQQTSQYAVLKSKKATIVAQITSLKSLRLAAYGPSGVDSTATVSDYVPTYSADAAGRAVKFAYDQIGKPYAWAADGPSSYDCSGLTMAAWQAGGVSLPHNAAQQYDAIAHIAKSDLQPGDLVFYYSPIHHVAIYIGDGHIIQAPQVGEDVQIASIGIAPIYGYGRPA